jgi:hypothetical protein
MDIEAKSPEKREVEDATCKQKEAKGNPNQSISIRQMKKNL